MNIKGNFSSIEQITDTYLGQQTAKSKQKSNVSFETVLKEKASIQPQNLVANQGQRTESTLKFSKHAGQRLEQRNITLSKEQLNRLNTATTKAEQKGIKDSLMLMDNMAFIVNVKSNTVVTAMYQAEESDKVFTNIDGAVIA